MAEPVKILVADFSQESENIYNQEPISNWVQNTLEEFDSIQVIALNQSVAPDEQLSYYKELMEANQSDLLIFGSVTALHDSTHINFYYIPADYNMETNAFEPFLREFTIRNLSEMQTEIPYLLRFNTSALATMTLLNSQLIDEAYDASEKTLTLAQMRDFSEIQSSAFHIRGMVFQLGIFNPDSALDDYNTALSLNPENTSVLESRASLYSDLGYYNQAIVDMNRLLELDPNNIPMLYYRGSAYSKSGQYEKALLDLNSYLQLVPDDVDAIYVRSLTRANMGEIDAALNDFHRVIELDPEHINAYINQAQLYLSIGQLEMVLPLLTRAMEIDNTNLRIYNTLLVLLITNENWQSVIEYSNVGLALAPEDPFFYKSRSIGYLATDQFNLAYEDIEYVIQSFKDGIFGSATNREIDPLIATAEELTMFVNLTPNSSEYFHMRGIYYFHQDQLTKAINDFTEALAINPQTYYALFYRAMAHADSGNKQGAIHDLQAFLLLCPEGTDDAKFATSQLDRIQEL